MSVEDIRVTIRAAMLREQAAGQRVMARFDRINGYDTLADEREMLAERYEREAADIDAQK